MLECPVNIEGKVGHWRDLAENDAKVRGRTVTFELRIQRVHLASSSLKDGNPNRIDPGKWRSLIMSFARFCGLTQNELAPSTLAAVPEEVYRSPDADTARAASSTQRD